VTLLHASDCMTMHLIQYICILTYVRLACAWALPVRVTDNATLSTVVGSVAATHT
jgi:hypothetical protein